MKYPSRQLLGPKPLRYVSAMDTDIRRTFRRARLLARLKMRKDSMDSPGARATTAA